MAKIPQTLTHKFSARLKTNELLAPYTYIKIGGPAEYLLTVNTVKDLCLALNSARKDRVPVTILGSASNVCIADTGLKGLVIINRAQKLTLLPNHCLLAESGTLMNRLVNFSLDHDLSGLSGFLGLPGTVGGAVVNNSHHLDQLVGSLIKSVTALNKAGEIKTFTTTDCGFAYDRSVFQTNGAIILTAEFALKAGSANLKAEAMAALLRRRQTQPLEAKSSGCMFKNPPKPHPSAGFMIDHLGLKNFQIGGAKVSEKHANFIVNTGQATSADMVALSNLIQTKVEARYHLHLEREIFFLGNHPGL
jgi:UDP-N-acetylmuramate dehydrogenase